MEQDNTYIRFDWAIKHILRDKANFGILEGLISVLLNEEVHIVELLESESNQESDTDRFNRVDIKAKNSKGHLIIVEVQLTRQLHYLYRIYYGTCRAITKRDYVGDKYDQVKKVYSISLLYCDYGRGLCVPGLGYVPTYVVKQSSGRKYDGNYKLLSYLK